MQWGLGVFKRRFQVLTYKSAALASFWCLRVGWALEPVQSVDSVFFCLSSPNNHLILWCLASAQLPTDPMEPGIMYQIWVYVSKPEAWG